MKITKHQLRRIIQEELSSADYTPAFRAAVDKLDEFSLDELDALQDAVTKAWWKKQNEAKAQLKKGDVVTFIDHDGHRGEAGAEVEGVVKGKGFRWVSVAVDGQIWKRAPASLRKKTQ